MRGRRTLKDPAWKSGPTHPEPTSSEHAIDPQPTDHDVDGFGVDEAEMVEGEPLIALQESHGCGREGCDATHTHRILFTTDTLNEAEMARLDWLRGTDELSSYVYDNHERVDQETIDVDGIQITAETIETDEATGPCYGIEEPDPEPHGL